MPPIAQIRGLLFDKDGTLLDFNRTWFDVVMRLAQTVAPGDEDARQLVEAGGYDWNTGRFRSGSVVAAGTVADLVDLWHPPGSDADRAAQVATFERLALAHVRPVPVPGLQATLETLASGSYRLGIATNDSEAGARQSVVALGLASLFDAVIGYDSVPRPKPSPDQLLLFARQSGLAPTAIAMIGDNPHDLEMAHAAGAGLAIGVLTGNSSRADLAPLAHPVLDSITDLPAFLADA